MVKFYQTKVFNGKTITGTKIMVHTKFFEPQKDRSLLKNCDDNMRFELSEIHITGSLAKLISIKTNRNKKILISITSFYLR